MTHSPIPCDAMGGIGKKKEAERPTYTSDWRQRLRLAAGATTKHEAARIYRSILNDMVIDSDKQMHERTGVTPDNFDFVCEALENELIGDGGAPCTGTSPGGGVSRPPLRPAAAAQDPNGLGKQASQGSQKNTVINYGIDQSDV